MRARALSQDTLGSYRRRSRAGALGRAAVPLARGVNSDVSSVRAKSCRHHRIVRYGRCLRSCVHTYGKRPVPSDALRPSGSGSLSLFNGRVVTAYGRTDSSKCSNSPVFRLAAAESCLHFDCVCVQNSFQVRLNVFCGRSSAPYTGAIKEKSILCSF